MAKMKKYFLYIGLILLFALFSNFLIAVGLNSTYKEIYSASEKSERLEIFQAEATKVNGRLRGVIHNSKDINIQEKYLKIDFYSARDVNMGSKYVEINNKEYEIPFEVFFKLNNVAYYKTSFVNEKDPKGEIELIPKDLKKSDIIFATIVAFLLFQ